MPLISDAIGRVLGGRYRLVSALGVGASAQVFLAEDVSLQRHVAIKVLQPALAADQGFLKRFRAEARAAAALNHPHIARVFDWGEDGGDPYLVLEYLGGGSLLDLLERGVRLSVAQAASVAAQAARGLAHAHARGLVHRDVKPANLLFDDEGRVRVTDFGVARALAEGAWTEPVGNGVIGTARYAAPEQAQGLALDGRADVYSLALVTYESLAGDVPFVRDTPMGTLAARIGAPLPGNRALGALQPLLTDAAAPAVADRLDAATFASRLEALGAELPAPQALPLALSPRPSRGGPPTLAGFPSTPHVEATVPDGHTDLIARPVRVGAGGVFDAIAHPGPKPGRSGGERHRRRLPFVVLAIGLVLALLATALVLALRKGVFTPSHPVPAVTGMTLTEARQAVAKDHFLVATGESVTSITVKAGDIVRQAPSPRTTLKQGSTIRVVVSSGLPSEPIPSLTGLGCNGATRLLEVNHLKAVCPVITAYSSTVPAGMVVNWSYNNKIDPKQAPYGSTVAIAVSKGSEPKTIPNVINFSYQQAVAELEQLGLTVTGTTGPSTTVPAGMVAATSPPPGSLVAPGSAVTVSVSTGPPMTGVPDLTGATVAQAQATLAAAHLALGMVVGPPTGHVAATLPVAGTPVPEGTAVNIYTA